MCTRLFSPPKNLGTIEANSVLKFYQQIGLHLAALLFSLLTRQTHKLVRKQAVFTFYYYYYYYYYIIIIIIKFYCTHHAQ